ncbi:translocation/assembly module TamB domain-containing protein [Deinococcus altitudinis]|uniref:translocation/assembly module TamB domain-containing protein n=1 Tax=Deinococcus altitudinis TaxID=468914 RepID=UPI003891E084
MTAPVEPNAVEPRPAPVPPARRRWGWWLLLAVLALVLLVCVFGPALFGQAILARLGGDYRVTAGKIAGPLWAPTASALKVTGPGVDVQAGTVVVGLSSLDLIGRSARLDLTLKDATVALKLKTLLSGQGGGGGGGFQILPGKIDAQNTRLNIDGTGFDVPSGTWTAQSVQANGQDALKISGATTDGPLNALVKYRTVAGQLQGSADLDADARIINHYWKDKNVGGITGGQIRGRYSFGSGPVTGDLQLSNASLAVPGASFVKVTDLNGSATHRGGLIAFTLKGLGWNGPVTANGSVDLKAHQWDVKAQAAPQLSALGKALGQGGKGVASLNVHAYGWNTVTVTGDISSPQGEFSVLPYRNLKASYLYRRDKKELNNDLTFSADTRFQGEQKLSGKWTFNKAGVLAWTGTLLSKPLNLAGTISARNVITASGQAIGGPLRGSLGLADKTVTLIASPDFYSVSGDLTARGTLDRLNIALKGGKAGPVEIAGTAVFGKTGLKADLGPIQLDLDRQLRGTWQANGLSTSGLLLTGAGALKVPEASLTGTMRATVPLLSSQPSGPLSLNWQKRTADWTFAGGDLKWRGETFTLRSGGLSALGYDLRGSLGLTTALKASGEMRASSGKNVIVATGLGDHLDLKATQNGVNLSARTLLTAGFPTSIQVQGADVNGTVSVAQGAPGVQFTLNTAGRLAQGSLNGQNWNASGEVNLASLSPLIGSPLSGTARLNLAGQGGTVQLAGSGFGATLNGTLTRSKGVLSAQANVGYTLGNQGAGGQVAAQLGGRVYPDLNLSGPVTVTGTAVGDQTVQAQLYGPYGNIQTAIRGQLSTLVVGGVTLPAQALAVQGRLTPALNLSGSYGGLNLKYAGGPAQSVQVQGVQTLQALGYSGQVNLDASYGPGWAGALNASGQLGPYSLNASGPWSSLSTTLSSTDGLRASGTVNVPTQSYDLKVRGPVAGLYVQGTVAGTGTQPKGDLLVSDGGGGSARVTLNGLQDFQIQVSSLTLAGQKVQGQLSAVGGLLSGTLSAGPLQVVARSGQFQASGTLYNHTLNASGKLTLPGLASTFALSNLNVNVNGPLLSATATGSGSDLRGSVRLKAQQYGGIASLPNQILPLQASVVPLQVNLGGLRYAGGGWAGQAALKYALGGQTGRLRLAGSGAELTALPSGPLQGRLQVLPALGGTLSAPLSHLLTLLPAQIRQGLSPTLQPGRLNAVIQPSGAALTLAAARYQGQPLGLQANASWKGGLKVSAVLTHPGTRIPVAYDGRTLTVRGARIDALALRPVLSALGVKGLDVSGSVRADLNLPGLDFGAASARLNVDLKASGQQARGTVNLQNGNLSADLNSTLGGQALTLSGPIYPQARAVLTLGELTARLNGDLRGKQGSQQGQQATLDVSGRYQEREVALKVVGELNPAQVTAIGTVAGLNLSLQAKTAAQTGWKVSGTFGATDLTALLGTAGTVSGTLQGSLNDLALNAAGRIAGADFTVPARYRGGVLSVARARVTYAGTPAAGTAVDLATARISGTVYPALGLSGPVTLTDYLPGTYTLTASGPFSKPDLRLSGRTTGGPRGLDAPGSAVTARLLGRDWKLTATGEQFGGGARGRFGSGDGVPAGLVEARFTVRAPYRSGAQTVDLNGVTGWSPAAGFLGELRLGGVVSGQTLAATLRGHGDLSLEALLGSGAGSSGTVGGATKQASVYGLFPASLPLRPGGRLTLRSFDIGALWSRPEQLRLSAEASVGGRTWGQLGATLNGQLADAEGELSGAVSASVQSAGGLNGSLKVAGRKLNASASLNGREYQASVTASGARLARLLPASAGVGSLTLSGAANLSGSTADITMGGGLRELRASGLDLSGTQTQTGPFRLSGSVLYTPQGTQASLNGTIFGGSVQAMGTLPGGLNVRLSNLKPTSVGLETLNGALTLSGPATDPRLAGRLNLSRRELTASLDVSGTASDPRLLAAANLRGDYAGRVLADVTNLKLSPLAASVHLYGAASQGSNKVNLDLNGEWPRLAGTATAQVSGLKQPVTLTGDGQGSYALAAGTLGSGTLKLDGFVPSVTASAHLTPLELIGGSGPSNTQQASADVTLSGPLSQLNLVAQANVTQAQVSGVSVKGVTLNVAGPLTGPQSGTNRLTGTLSQGGKALGTLTRGTLTFAGLTAEGYGLQASATGKATLSGSGSAALNLSGAGVKADLKAAYAGGSFSLSGQASASGVNADLNTTGSLRNGWNGTLALDGGPEGVITAPGRFTLSGPVAQPLLAGELGLGGAGVRLVANRQNVQLRLVNGPDAEASGVLNLNLERSLWEGRATYSRMQGGEQLASLAVRLSGAAGDPQASLEASRGSWKASGTASRSGADLNVTDGEAQGRVRWDGTTVGINLPGLALGGLNLSGLQGHLKATGTVNTAKLDGAVQLGLSDFQSGYTVPSVNLPLEGDLSGLLTLDAGRVSGQATLKSGVGTVALSLSQKERGGTYGGTFKAQIQQPASPASTAVANASTVNAASTAQIAGPPAPGQSAPTAPAAGAVQTTPSRPGGTLSADLTLDASGLKGSVSAQALNLSLGGLNAHLSGTAVLDGRTFTVQAGANSDVTGDDSQVSLSSSGGLADLVPQLTSLAGIQPTGEGYSLRASLNGLELSGLKVAPNLSGRVSGDAVISDGAGTFVLRSSALKLGDTVLATRIDGTLVGGDTSSGGNALLSSDWRIRGVVGNSTAATSQLSGSLSGGVLSGTFQMRGLPLDAFLSAFSGTLPGRGQLTGLARFRIPLADPLAGEMNVVAERVTVSSTMLAAATDSAASSGSAGSGSGGSNTAGSSSVGTAAQGDTAPQTITQTLTGSGFLRYAGRELQNVDLHLSGAGRWDVTGQYTRRAVGVTASFQNTTFTPALLFIPSLREQAPSLQGTLSLSVMGSYDRPVGTISGSNLQGALGSISLRIPALSGQLPDSGLFTVEAGLQAGGSVGADGKLDISGRLSNLNLSDLSIRYSGLLIPQGLGRIENVQATVLQVNPRTSSEGYTIQAQAVGGLGVGSLNLQGSLSPRYNLQLSARNFNLPISLIYGRQSSINADLNAVEQGRAGQDGPIVVTGSANIASLTLGTGSAAGSGAVLPAPASAGGMTGSASAAGTSAADNYSSPLPEPLTVFPTTAQQQAEARRVSPLLSRIVFRNIPISAPTGIRVDESIGRAELGGNLVLAGTGSAPTLSGRIGVIRGSVDLRDNSFNIDSGSAVFGGTSLYPVLSASATGNVPLPEGGQVGVRLSLDGRFGPQPSGVNALTLDTRLSCVTGCVSGSVDLSASNPNAEAQLYSLVAVGTPDLSSLPSNLGTFGTSALKTALNLFVLGEVQRNIARALGVDVFRINAALPGENGSTTFGATFTVGSYLTKELYLQYRVDLTGLGLLDATYTTPNNLFTFKASTPLQGFDLSTLRPSFSAAYNFTNRSSVQIGVQSGNSTQVNFGYLYRW